MGCESSFGPSMKKQLPFDMVLCLPYQSAAEAPLRPEGSRVAPAVSIPIYIETRGRCS